MGLAYGSENTTFSNFALHAYIIFNFKEETIYGGTPFTVATK